MGLRDFVRSLVPGDDHELAATQYAGRESATETARRKSRERYRRQTEKSAAKASKWETKDRARDKRGTTSWTW